MQLNGHPNESVIPSGTAAELNCAHRDTGGTHLHGTSAFVSTSLSCCFKAVSHSLARRPVNRCQLFHELLQADNAVVLQERLQPEMLRVGDVQLGRTGTASHTEPGGTMPHPEAHTSPHRGRPQPRPPPPPHPAPGDSRWCRADGGGGTRSTAARPASG